MILGRSHVDILGFLQWTVGDMAEIIQAENGKEKPRRDSGYFTLYDAASIKGIPIIIFAVDVCPPEKREQYFAYSQEKAVRLAQNSEHISSWQSRNPEKNCYGGAIRVGPAKNLIMSFSGLPELADEAVMLATALRLLWMSHDEAIQIAKASNNQYFGKLAKKVWLDNPNYISTEKLDELLAYLEKCEL